MCTLQDVHVDPTKRDVLIIDNSADEVYSGPMGSVGKFTSVLHEKVETLLDSHEFKASRLQVVFIRSLSQARNYVFSERVPVAIILSGSNRMLTDATFFIQLSRASCILFNIHLRYKVAVLGICFGHQLINAMFGGTLLSKDSTCRGEIHVHLNPNFSLSGQQEAIVHVANRDYIERVAPGFVVTARSSDRGEIMGTQCIESNIYTTQYHPEIYNIDQLANFLRIGLRWYDANVFIQDRRY